MKELLAQIAAINAEITVLEDAGKTPMAQERDAGAI